MRISMMVLAAFLTTATMGTLWANEPAQQQNAVDQKTSFLVSVFNERVSQAQAVTNNKNQAAQHADKPGSERIDLRNQGTRTQF